MRPDGATGRGRLVRSGGTEREDHRDSLGEKGRTAQGGVVAAGRFRGNDVAPGALETGRVAPRLRRWGTEWIPAYAGMTERGGAMRWAMG